MVELTLWGETDLTHTSIASIIVMSGTSSTNHRPAIGHVGVREPMRGQKSECSGVMTQLVAANDFTLQLADWSQHDDISPQTTQNISQDEIFPNISVKFSNNENISWQDLSEMKEKINRYYSAPAASFKPRRWSSDKAHFRTVVLNRNLHSEYI